MLNVFQDFSSLNRQIGAGRDTALGVESNDYWVAYLQVTYQGDPTRDYDPNFNDDPNAMADLAGQTTGTFSNIIVTNEQGVPAGGEGSLIYIETLRDYFFNNNNVSERGLNVAHELGHQFGIQGHRDTDAIMKTSTVNVTTSEEYFIPAHLNMIRWRVKSPGQP